MSEFEYWYIGMVSISTALFSTVFIVLHSHVWVRNGYSGINQVLELNEVDRFVAHVISEVCLVMMWLLITFEPLIYVHTQYQVSLESKLMLSGGFLGSGLYVVFRGKLKKIIDNK